MRVHSLDGRVFEMDDETLAACEIPPEEIEKLLAGETTPLAEPLPPGQLPPPPKPPPGVAEAAPAAQPVADGVSLASTEWVDVTHRPGQIVIDIRQPEGTGEPAPEQ